MRIYRLTVAYDGTEFHGFQRQPGVRTVQEVLERALEQLLSQEVTVVAAGRTDRGVHAEGQVVSFRATLPMPVEALPRALNGLLPSDVAVREAASAPEGFHARFSAQWKEYVYTFFHDPLRAPLKERYAWRVPFPLEGERMEALLPLLRGWEDYRPFCQVGPEVEPARSLMEVDLQRQGSTWRLRVRAQSFLYKMVRRLTGLLVEVGRGRVALEEVPEYLQGRRSPETLLVAPPQGLCLMQVGYAEENGGSA